jgi:hypothetical protein
MRDKEKLSRHYFDRHVNSPRNLPVIRFARVPALFVVFRGKLLFLCCGHTLRVNFVRFSCLRVLHLLRRLLMRPVCVCMHVCMYVFVYVCIYTCLFMSVSRHVRVYMRVCVYVCVHTYIHIYTHKKCRISILLLRLAKEMANRRFSNVRFQ